MTPRVAIWTGNSAPVAPPAACSRASHSAVSHARLQLDGSTVPSNCALQQYGRVVLPHRAPLRQYNSVAQPVWQLGVGLIVSASASSSSSDRMAGSNAADASQIAAGSSNARWSTLGS